MIDRSDAAARDSDVKAPTRRTGAVDDVAAGEEDIKVHRLRVEFFVAGLGQQLPGHPVVAREQASVHRQHDAGDPGRIVRGKEHGRVGDVIWLAHTPEGVPLEQPLEHDRIAVDARLPDWGADGAWRDRVAPDPVGAVAMTFP